MRGVLPLLLAGLSLGSPATAPAQDASVMPAAHGEALPPAVIRGLGLRPSTPLEFSRAWLVKADAVRRRRAELEAARQLEGRSPPELARLGAALGGELRIPVLAVRYADVPAPFPVMALAERLFGGGVGDTISLPEYWREVSGGLVRVEGVVSSWVPLRKPARHYLRRSEYGWGRFGRVAELRRQVIEYVDPSFDFSLFDNDGPDGVPNSGDDDGYVDFVAFYYAIRCGVGAPEGAIWPHRGAMAPYDTNDEAAGGGRIRIADYVILPAQDPRTCGPSHVGVLAHETGHAFGLPDLYDYDGSSRGIGSWGLMGTGSHASPHSPAHLGPWAKEQLGWVRVDRLASAATALLPPVQRSARVLRHDLDDGTGRYLLLENRTDQGSDRDLPGHGLLVWSVDPERGELGAWNGDERRPAVGLLGVGSAGELINLDGRDESGPFPGISVLPRAGGDYELVVTMVEELGLLRVGVLPLAAEHRSERPLRLSTVPDAAPVRRELSLGTGATESAQLVHGGSRWLRFARQEGAVLVEADPLGLAPGTYVDTIRILDPLTGEPARRVPIVLDVAGTARATVMATDLPWSWGMAAGAGGLIHASYGWDNLGLRPRPRLLRVGPDSPFPATLSRLPAEALYAPVAGPDGSTYVLAHARGRNLIYRVEVTGTARLITPDVGSEPAYGLAGLPDGSLLLAGFSGRILRVTPDAEVTPWADLGRAAYQIAADGAGVAYAALLSGQVARIEPGVGVAFLDTGFERGNLVAVATAPDGRVFAAERGGKGRIVEVRAEGPRVVTRAPGASFFGLAADETFLYALDLNRRELLRVPIAAGSRRVIAVRSEAAPAGPR